MAFHLRFSRSAVLLACLLLAPSLPAAGSPLPPDVQQRLDLLKSGYEAYLLSACTQPYEQGLTALNKRVTPALERERDAAAQRTDLDTLVRIKSDLERIAKGQVLTEADAPPPVLKNTYATYKVELAKVDIAKKASLAEARRRYDMGLAKLQNDMTTAQQVDAALEVKKLRESLAAADAPAGATTAAAGKDSSPPGDGENLLSASTLKWEMTMHDKATPSKLATDRKVLFHEKPTLRIINPTLNDTRLAQKVKVKPDTRYRLSGFIKAQDIKDAQGRSATDPAVKVSAGASLLFKGKTEYRSNAVNTDTWTEVSHEFKTLDEETLVIECRLGYFGGTVSGTAWFADLALTELKPE